MIGALLEWFLVDSFPSFLDLIQSVATWVLGLFTSLGAIFINLLLDLMTAINGLLPDPTPVLNFLEQMFDIASQYLGYIVDMSFVLPSVLTYFVVSWIFRILARRNTYIIKLIIGWIHRLIP